MSVQGTISQAELAAALQLERAGRRKGFLVVAAVAFVAGLALAARGGAVGLVLVAVAVGLLLSEFASGRVLIPWRARRLYGEGSSFRLPGEYDWTPTHFHSRNERGEATMPWTEVRDVLENERVFLVRHRSGRLQIVPKSWFDDAALASFRAAAPLRRGAAGGAR